MKYRLRGVASQSPLQSEAITRQRQTARRDGKGGCGVVQADGECGVWEGGGVMSEENTAVSNLIVGVEASVIEAQSEMQACKFG